MTLISVVQIAFTGRLVKRLGLPLSLAALPLAAGAMLLGIAASPTPTMVALAEIVRKVSLPNVFHIRKCTARDDLVKPT